MAIIFRIVLFLASYHGTFAQDGPIVLNCPRNILHVVPFGQTSVQVSWDPPLALDPTVTPSSTHKPPATFDVGEKIVSYVYLKNGVSTECRFTVEVQQLDTTPPQISGCPRGVTATIGYSEDKVPVDWVEPTATDNTGSTVRFSRRSHPPGHSFPPEFTSVEYTFIDAYGNENSCNFTVTVNLDDVIPPVVSDCPTDVEMSVENHQVYEPVTWAEPTATDESPSGGVQIVRQSHIPGDKFRAGVTNVLYVFSDESQNKAICNFQIHLRPPGSPSVHSCPRSFIHDASDPEPEVSDPEFITTMAFNGDTSTEGNRTFTRSQIDGSIINTIICSYEIYIFTVSRDPPPPSSCTLPSLKRTAALGSRGASVDYTTPENTASISQPSGSFFPVGETVVAYVVQDEEGNVRVCSFNVVVSLAIIGCSPRTIHGDAKTDGTELQVYWPSPSPAVVAARDPPSHTTGSFFPLGTTEVSHSFTDPSGTSESCVFQIKVVQANPLTINSCPSHKNFTLPDDSSTVVVTWMEPEPVNNFDRSSPVLEVDQSHDSGTAFSVGNTTVIYQYMDSNRPEFTVNCTFVVAVEDITDPKLTGCQDRFELSAFVWYGTQDWKSLITVIDNSDDVTVTTTPGDDYQYPFEETNFTLVAIDSSGNEAICEAIVVFSLFLPVPVLAVIGVVILLVLLALLICCCRCRRRCKNGEDKDGDEDTARIVSRKSQPTPQNDPPTRKTSSAPADTFPQGNSYVTQISPAEPSAPPSTTVNNPSYQPETGDSSYTYIDGDMDVPPPLPTTPRPGSNADPSPSEGVSYLKPKDSSQVYLYPTHQNTNESQGYLYPDRNGGDQGYMKPDLKPAEYSYSYDHTLMRRGFNDANADSSSGSSNPVPARRQVASYFEPVE